MQYFKICLLATLTLALTSNVSAQQQLTREQILSMTTDQLSELPLEDLMAAVETLGVSSVDELFNLIMNKNVSSASKHEESSFTSPLATTVITQEEIRSYGCSTIEEAMRLIPGMIVTQKTNGVYDVQMRGLNNIPDNSMLVYSENNNTLLMVDGRVLHNYSIGAMSMENLPIGITDIERIEVVRGACSALYGVNAINGVINIITRKANDTNAKISGSFQMGNQGTFVGDVALRKAFNNKISAGITFNIQQRQRPTDKLRTFISGTNYIDRGHVLKTGLATAYTKEQVDEYVNNGTLIPVEPNELISLDDMNDLREISYASHLAAAGDYYSAYTTVPKEYKDAHNLFRDPDLARKTLGINGYLTITPNDNVRFDLTGGYSHNHVAQTTLLINPYSFNQRYLKKGYVNLAGRIHDFSFLANYSAGPEDYAIGRPGNQVKSQQVFASGAYDINLGDNDSWGELTIRPGVAYQYIYSYDKYSYFDYGDGNGPQQLSGFFNSHPELWSIAPSLRLDYRKNDFRLILSFRDDKTNIPDKWNPSSLGSISYNFNDKNFIRFVYGHSVRSANLVNTSASFRWPRGYGMNMPAEMLFQGDENGKLVNIDNFEIGYRAQPTNALLIDAELFYSKSDGYGCLSSDRSEVYITTGNVSGMYSAISTFDLTNPSLVNQMTYMLMQAVYDGYISTRNYVRYKNLPYKVNQMGFGINVDWIITPKLVAKINANIQRTTIDNYYSYNQTEEITNQLTQCISQMAAVCPEVVGNLLGYEYSQGLQFTKIETDRTAADFLEAITHTANVSIKDYYNTLSPDQQRDFTQQLKDGWFAGNDEVTIDGVTYQTPLTLYYYLRYGIQKKGDEIRFADTESIPHETVNGHKHKATPSVYGMFGLIYKPLEQLNLSAYGNFVGKRSFNTLMGTQELDPRFTLNLKVGYKPIEACEFFINANNLFNKKKQEFAYSDEIGGIYTVGVNFNF